MHRFACGLLLAAVLMPCSRTVAQEPGAADAYLDASAAELVRLARVRRALLDLRIQSYHTTATERMSIGLRAGIGERLIFRRETASRIDWSRDTVRIEVLGAREVIPVAKAAPQVPAGIAGYMPVLAFDPVDSEMLLRLDSTVIRHPLAGGSEQFYRFRTGDSTVIRLPEGREVRLRELEIIPRRRDHHLITGSFWIDLDTHAVVQAFFRLARGYDAARDDDDDDTPFFLKPVRADLDYIAIEYGLWDLTWWLPRSVAARGLVQAGALRLPLGYERRYDDYTVVGNADVPGPDPAVPVMETRPCRPRPSFSIMVSNDPDSVRERRAAERVAQRRARRDSARARAGTDTTKVCDREFVVTQAARAELLRSELLSSDIYDEDDVLLDPAELRAIAERVRGIPSPPWLLERPVLQIGPTGPGLARYNRVEGLSVGARALFDFGVLGADTELRVGVADWEPRAHIGVSRAGTRVYSRLAAYRRLDVLDIASGPFSIGSSASALLLGRDPNDYFQSTGVELALQPPETRTQWYDLRLFAEAQRSVSKETDFSLVHVFDEERDFRPNIVSDEADQAGATLRLRTAGGQNPAALRWGAELELHGEVGDFNFTRPALRLRASRPLVRSITLATEVAGGTSFGTAPAQRQWQLGGFSTLRGYDAAAVRGVAFWNTRAELGIGFTALRLALFGDAGWAGPRADFERSRPLRSAGAGVSALDGLFRIDVARALDPPRGWKVHLRLNGIL